MVTVAERRIPVALSGGLDVVPHFTLAEFDARLGRDPDLIVIPNIEDVGGNDAVREWVRRHCEPRLGRVARHQMQAVSSGDHRSRRRDAAKRLE